MANQNANFVCVRARHWALADSSECSRSSETSGGSVMQVAVQQAARNMHIYDHEKSRLYLENGKVVRVRDKVKRSADDVLQPLTEAARRKGLIGLDDMVVTFSC